MGGHEIYSFGGDQLGSTDKIALILPVLIIHHDDDLTIPDIIQGFFNAI
jgi:hypothetical protein